MQGGKLTLGKGGEWRLGFIVPGRARMPKHKDPLEQLAAWQRAGRGAALATVVRTWGSSPRPVGSLLAISDSGDFAGSISGGCVEGAVVEAALGVISNGAPQLLEFGVSDESAWSVGLTCGGQLEVFIERVE